MTSFLSRLFASKSGTSTPERLRVRPSLEALEVRDTPTVALTTAGDILIKGTPGNDTASVTLVNANGDTYYKVTLNGVDKLIKYSKVTGGDLTFKGFDGNDTLADSPVTLPLRIKAYGGSGNDVLYGNAHNDHLEGGDGADQLYGNAGDDYLDGGLGYDQLFGSLGNDTLVAGSHDSSTNTLDGSLGDDFLYGSDGDDVLYAGDG